MRHFHYIALFTSSRVSAPLIRHTTLAGHAFLRQSIPPLPISTMSHLSCTSTTSPRFLSPMPFLSLLFVVLLICPVSIRAQTCDRNSCSPDQGTLPTYPANSCDLCTTTGSCSAAYYNSPGFSCGNATLTVNGAVTLRRSECCPNNYDGESEFVCVSERHSQDDGMVNGYSCVKVGAVVSVLRVGMLIGAAVCAVVFAAISFCVWRFYMKAPEEHFTLPQYQQPLVDSAPQSSLSSYQPSEPAAQYQPPAPQVPLFSEHRPQYDRPSDAHSQ